MTVARSLLLAVCLSGSARATLAQTESKEIDARIARLRRSFECINVEGASDFVCSMKDGFVGSGSRKRIEPVVVSSGTIFLRSVYRDRDWIYHDHVIVHVTRRETRKESSRDRRSGRYTEDRNISESVRYRGSSDNGILRAIAEAGDAKVTMRLAGGPRVFDKTLSDDEKRLFAEAMELATLLRRRATQAAADTSLETVFENHMERSAPGSPVDPGAGQPRRL